MLSVRSRTNLIARGHSVRSYAFYIKDSCDEALDKIREQPGLARAIVQFGAACHLVTLGALAFAYAPGDMTGYRHLLLWATAAWMVLVAWLLFHVGLLRDDNGTPEPALRWANKLTIVRFILTVPVVVTILDGRWVAALVAYIVCAGTDVADGIVARRRNERTRFGRTMDPMADVVSNGAVFAALVAIGMVPAWVFVVLMLRYGSLLLGSIVLFFAVGPIRFDSTSTGKVVGVLQALVVIMVLALVRQGIEWRNSFGYIVFAFLGAIFASVIVSQLVMAVKHVRKGLGNVRS